MARVRRKAPLPKGWERIRRLVLRRDPTCGVCGINPSTQVDHVDGHDNHDPANLQGICSPCHDEKTLGQAAEGTRSYWRARSKGRPAEPHPGTLRESPWRN